MRVLLIEDNTRLADALATGLDDEGYTVDVARTGEHGLELALAPGYDVIVLDLMLPGIDGLSILRRARAARVEVPVLILTARDELEDRVGGLDAGADDYLAKPFAFEELLARLRAIIRRREGGASNLIRVADLEVDTLGKVVRRGGDTIDLSAREYALLEYLARRAGRTVSRDQILAALYEPDAEPASNVVEVFVGQLRRKIDRDRDRKLIHTRRGLGYVLEEST